MASSKGRGVMYYPMGRGQHQRGFLTLTLNGQGRDPNMLRAQYLENSWRCYLATIAEAYYIVSCEALRSCRLS